MRKVVRRSFMSCVLVYYLLATATKGLSTSGSAEMGGAEEEVTGTYFCVLRRTNMNSITWDSTQKVVLLLLRSKSCLHKFNNYLYYT